MSVNYIFVGGSGRSGTSYLAALLGKSPHISSINDVELKFFGENGGLPDLYHALVLHYSLTRSVLAIKNFRILFHRLFASYYQNQATLDHSIDEQSASSILEDYIAYLCSGEENFPREITSRYFNKRTRQFVSHLYEAIENDTNSLNKHLQLVDRSSDSQASKISAKVQYRLEKTPHNLLNARLLNQIFDNPRFVHVTRDPRAVVFSLQQMSWAPDSLEECVEWYRCYNDSWLREKLRLELEGTQVLSMAIEDLHSSPMETMRNLNSYLALDTPIELYNFDFETLTAVQRKIEPRILSVATELLSEELHMAGYCLDQVGIFQNSGNFRQSA